MVQETDYATVDSTSVTVDSSAVAVDTVAEDVVEVVPDETPEPVITGELLFFVLRSRNSRIFFRFKTNMFFKYS